MEIRMRTLAQVEADFFKAASDVTKENNLFAKAAKVDALIEKQVAAMQIIFKEIRESIMQQEKSNG